GSDETTAVPSSTGSSTISHLMGSDEAKRGPSQYVHFSSSISRVPSKSTSASAGAWAPTPIASSTIGIVVAGGSSEGAQAARTAPHSSSTARIWIRDGVMGAFGVVSTRRADDIPRRVGIQHDAAEGVWSYPLALPLLML